MTQGMHTRTELLFGSNNIEKLKQAKICIIGLGAVGGTVCETLARTSVGNLLLSDFDVIDKTNINRQILALNSTVGLKKSEAAKARVKDINPNCSVIVKDIFFDSSNAGFLHDFRPDIVVDAIDSFDSKLYLLKYCVQNNIPVVSSMGAALKTDLSLIKFSSLDKTSMCPLAKKLRTALKKEGVNLKIPCVFSQEAPKKHFGGAAASDDREQAYKNKMPLGSAATVTAAFGLHIAAYVINFIINSKQEHQ